LISILFSSFVFGGEIFDKFPNQINTNENYVFYSHGFIVEGTNPIPKNERWGIYEFPAIKNSLSDSEYNLIAYHRPKGTDPFKHAEALASDVRKLLKNGVVANRITIIGFSRGAFITALTSHYLAETPVNTILLAACGRIASSKYAEIKANGDLLSIYETTDGSGTCKKLQNRSIKLKSFEEVSISTGKEHGAFYRPIPEWIVPVKQWIKEKSQIKD